MARGTGRARVLRIACLMLAGVAAMACGDAEPSESAGRGVGTSGAATEPAPDTPTRPGTGRTAAEMPADLEVLGAKLAWAYEAGLDTLPIGDVMVAIGRSFLGTPYEPGTLEIPGPERLVLNFEALDCVTFVENVLALSRFVRTEPATVLADADAYRSRYRDILRGIRYRGALEIEYPARLHYFSDWIADGQEKGLVVNEGRALGGVPDAEPIDFMSTHPDAYRQLSDPGTLERIRETEARISARPRYYLPEDRIAGAAPGIRDGDIIAATSTVAGLDVAHTGIALWIDGQLHLMHAPLVGESVQISERPLALRILDIGGQDGIMVARPVDPGSP